MSFPKNLPDPTSDYADFIIGLMQLDEPSNLVHYRLAAGKNSRLWIICVAQHIAEALNDEIVDVKLIKTDGDERINSYHPVGGAREFWQNGAEQGLKPDEIIKGWKAMQSITKEVEPAVWLVFSAG